MTYLDFGAFHSSAYSVFISCLGLGLDNWRMDILFFGHLIKILFPDIYLMAGIAFENLNMLDEIISQ